MRLISNLGNIKGREPEKENTPDHIDRAIILGYDVLVELKKEDLEDDIKMFWFLERGHRLWFSYDRMLFERMAERLSEFCIIKTRLIEHITSGPYNKLKVHQSWRTVSSGKGPAECLFLSPGYQLPDYGRAVIYLPEEAGPDEYDFVDLKSAYGICSNEIEGYKKLVEENR